MAGFFETLIRPDREELEMADRMVVSTAANFLQVGEFQFLQLAYREWFDQDMPEALVDKLFTDYMLHNEVPHWARHYARLVLTREQQGTLDDNDPAYHRYDNDYHTEVPQGVRRFCIASGILAFLFATSVLLAEMAVDEPTTLLPPYFDRKELEPTPQHAEAEDAGGISWGRADRAHAAGGYP